MCPAAGNGHQEELRWTGITRTGGDAVSTPEYWEVAHTALGLSGLTTTSAPRCDRSLPVLMSGAVVPRSMQYWK